MSSGLMPLRVLIKQVAADWCDLAGIEHSLRTISVTDLDGRRADPMRQALREAETCARQAWNAEPTHPYAPPEWHEAFDRGTEALVDALRTAVLVYGGAPVRIPRQVETIIRMAMKVAAVRQADGFFALVVDLEATAAALRMMRPDEHGKDRLTMAQVAQHLGLSVRTVQDYRLDGRLPEPMMVGRTPTWSREQIDQWQANRPGSGRKASR